MERVVIIFGPTASGKSSLAVETALARGGEIISVDSRQIYRELTIGTGKITLAEMQGVHHYGLDLVSITETYSARNFSMYARACIVDIVSRGKLPILCGGTGLYMDSVIYDLEVPNFESNSEFQAELESYRISQGNLALWERLNAVDPLYASEIHPNSYPYVMRGIEVFTRTGRSKKEFHSIRTPLYDIEYISPTDLSREELYDRINTRVSEMFSAGWIEEVRDLLASGVSVDAPGWNSIGYREVIEHLRGHISLSELITRVQQLTRNYAKRQITWGKRNSHRGF